MLRDALAGNLEANATFFKQHNANILPTNSPFFRMNIIKTDLRTLLTTKTLNSLMWLSMANKDKWTFDFSRAVARYFRNHRRCDDNRGQNKIATDVIEEEDITRRINELKHNIRFYRNNIAVMETELAFFKDELRKETELLQTLEQKIEL